VANFEQFDRLARSLPEVTVRPGIDGRPRYYVRGKFFAAHRDPRPDAIDEATDERLDDVIVVRAESVDAAMALLHERPDLFFTTPHFQGYPGILTRIGWLSRMDDAELREIVEDAWLTQAPRRLAASYLNETQQGD